MSWYGRGQSSGGPLGPRQIVSGPAQGVRHSLLPGTATMESLPAPHLPPPEGEYHGLTATLYPLPSSSFLDEGCLHLVVCVVLWAVPRGLGSQEGRARPMFPADSGPP